MMQVSRYEIKKYFFIMSFDITLSFFLIMVQCGIIVQGDTKIGK